MFIYVPLLVALVGLIMYLIAKTNAEVRRIGEILFFCGLLATLFAVSAGAWVHVFGPFTR
jgi:hypothetical protein